MSKKWEFCHATSWNLRAITRRSAEPQQYMLDDQEEFDQLLSAGWKPICAAIDSGWPIRTWVCLRRRRKETS